MGPRRRHRWGSHAKLADDATLLTTGPETTRELFQWPLDNAKSLVRPGNPGDAELRDRLHAHLLNGVIVVTDYSGFDCPREGLEVRLLGLWST